MFQSYFIIGFGEVAETYFKLNRKIERAVAEFEPLHAYTPKLSHCKVGREFSPGAGRVLCKVESENYNVRYTSLGLYFIAKIFIYLRYILEFQTSRLL